MGSEQSSDGSSKPKKKSLNKSKTPVEKNVVKKKVVTPPVEKKVVKKVVKKPIEKKVVKKVVNPPVEKKVVKKSPMKKIKGGSDDDEIDKGAVSSSEKFVTKEFVAQCKVRDDYCAAYKAAEETLRATLNIIYFPFDGTTAEGRKSAASAAGVSVNHFFDAKDEAYSIREESIDIAEKAFKDAYYSIKPDAEKVLYATSPQEDALILSNNILSEAKSAKDASNKKSAEYVYNAALISNCWTHISIFKSKGCVAPYFLVDHVNYITRILTVPQSADVKIYNNAMRARYHASIASSEDNEIDE